MTVAEDLRSAADLLEEKGWGQGRYRAEDGCMCVMGAIYYTCTGIAIPSLDVEPEDTERAEGAIATLRDFLELSRGLGHENRFGGVVVWNDFEVTNVEQVTTALREAAGAAA